MSYLETSGRETFDPGTDTPLSSHHSGGQGGAARRRIAKAVNRLTDALDRKNTYAYKNIDYDKEIRVLQLYPGPPRSPLLCCLIPCPLLDQNVQPISIDPKTIPYAALSYYWGDEEPEHEIYIFETPAAYDDWKDKRAILLPWMGHLLIRNNLRDALEQLRLEDKPVYLWADALCINQSNVKERTAQVARMHDVYTQAERVYIWLGKGNPIEAQRVFDFLRKILDLSELENLVERLETQRGSWEDDRRDCKLTIDLMKAKWFSRRWVIQELALATNAHIRCGHCEMPWLEFADAVALFMTKYDKIRRAFPRPNDYTMSRNNDDHHISSLEARALGANALVTTTSNLFRRSNEGRILQRLLSLEMLVSSMLLAFEASDPKDTVFAVLQIAKDIPLDDPKTHLTTGWTGILTMYLVSLFGIVLWKFEAHTLLPSTSNERITSDISLRNTALTARNGMVGFINYCMLALSLLLVFLICKMLSDIIFKVSLHIGTGSHVKKALDKRIEANYRKCLRDVCADFIEYCIEHSNSLDILCRHWAPEAKLSRHSDMVVMPSWILPITGAAFGGPEQSLRSRVNGNSFVGGTERRGHYTASGSLPPVFKFGKTKVVEETDEEEVTPIPGTYTDKTKDQKKELPPRFDGTLRVKGFQLGVIEKTAPMVGGVISRTALELCGWHKGHPAADLDLDQVWRILVANRGPDGTNPPNWYRRACKACLEWYDKEPEDTFNTNTLRNMQGTPTGKVEFLDRVQEVVWNRNVIRTKPVDERPYVGIAPEGSAKGDVICIFFGCSVPVVLQPQGDGEFKFIGECYVHGVMDGEAVDPEPRGKEQWFKMR